MRNFCWGEPGYSAIVRDFGRHPIQDWTVHRLVDGPAAYREARGLTVTTVPLPAGAAPSQCLDDVTGEFLDGATEAIVALVTAVDVTGWNVILVELGTGEADQSRPDVMAYEVLHVSCGA